MLRAEGGASERGRKRSCRLDVGKEPSSLERRLGWRAWKGGGADGWPGLPEAMQSRWPPELAQHTLSHLQASMPVSASQEDSLRCAHPAATVTPDLPCESLPSPLPEMHVPESQRSLSPFNCSRSSWESGGSLVAQDGPALQEGASLRAAEFTGSEALLQSHLQCRVLDESPRVPCLCPLCHVHLPPLPPPERSFPLDSPDHRVS